jgi:hypothetical protein
LRKNLKVSPTLSTRYTFPLGNTKKQAADQIFLLGKDQWFLDKSVVSLVFDYVTYNANLDTFL